MDWQKEEEKMVFVAGKAGIEYLKEIKQTDLRKLKKEEFIQFVQCVIAAFVEQRGK